MSFCSANVPTWFLCWSHLGEAPTVSPPVQLLPEPIPDTGPRHQKCTRVAPVIDNVGEGQGLKGISPCPLKRIQLIMQNCQVVRGQEENTNPPPSSWPLPQAARTFSPAASPGPCRDGGLAFLSLDFLIESVTHLLHSLSCAFLFPQLFMKNGKYTFHCICFISLYIPTNTWIYF